VNLHLEDPGLAEIGFALHPDAAGRSIMSTAVRLVRDYGFDVAGSRPSAGVRGRQLGIAAGRERRRVRLRRHRRRLLMQRGERRDAWVATITRDDPRRPLEWLEPVEWA
jgi:hypothetical protein